MDSGMAEEGEEDEEGAGPTVRVADDVCLWVGLPQDPVAPGGDVGPHLWVRKRRRKRTGGEEKERKFRRM